MSEVSSAHLAGAATAGAGAGLLSGLLGGAGGMLLVPGLRRLAKIPDRLLFPSSVAVMLPTAAAALCVRALEGPLPLVDALPYLPGSAVGGLLAGTLGRKIPLCWLHRIFGAVMLAGGVRFLWG